MIYGYNPAFLLAIVLVFFYQRVIYSTRVFYICPATVPLKLDSFLTRWQNGLDQTDRSHCPNGTRKLTN